MDVKEISQSILAPDIDAVLTEGWPHRSFPIQGPGKRNAVQVVIKRSVLEVIQEHGRSRTDVEVCGVLVGNCYRDERGPYLYVQGMIRGEHAENQAAQVTFTAETWQHIQQELDLHFAEQRILGWYHTHPGFGIFLSAMDLFIHENFFNESEQLALVYDPLSGADGLFVWHHGQAEIYSYLVEEDSEMNNPAPALPRVSKKLAARAGAHNGQGDLMTRLARLERRSSILTWSLAALVIVGIAWPLLLVWWEHEDSDRGLRDA